MSPPLLSMRGVHKSFRAGLLSPLRPALRGVDLEVAAGEVVGVVGESGSGKSTLARIAVGVCAPSGGQVSVSGRDPGREPVSRCVQLLFQDAGASLNPGLTAQQILEESARFHPPAPGSGASLASGGADRVSGVLARVGLLHRRQALPSQLSGGERRRLTLAQVWMTDAPLLIADEPTAGLDAARQADLMALLLSRRSPVTGFLLISHDFPLILSCCTRILVMQEGRIIDSFTPDALSHPDRHPWTRRVGIITGSLP